MIWLPSRSGRIEASSSSSDEPRDPLLEVVVGTPQPLGLALVAGRAVGPGQHVQPLELVAGVADVAAYGGVGPLARRRSRGSAGAARPAARPRRSSSLEKRSAFIRLRVSLAPTTSWWWKVTVPSASKRRVRGLPTSCISAANRETKSGPPPQPVLEVDRLLEHGQGVLVDVLVPVVLVALERAAPAARAARARPARSRPAASARAAGTARSTSLTSSSRTRSAEMISIRSAIAVIAATTVGVDGEAELGGEPGGPHHPQRVVGEGVLGRAGRAQHPVRQVDHPAVRVDELARRAAAPPSR